MYNNYTGDHPAAEAIGAIVLVIVIVFAVGVPTYIVGSCEASNALTDEINKRGYGEYYLDNKSQRQWRWKEDKPQGKINKVARKKKSRARRLVLDGNDKEMILSKLSVANLSSDNEFIYFDKLEDGTWRICVTNGTIPDFASLNGILIRPMEEDKSEE